MLCCSYKSINNAWWSKYRFTYTYIFRTLKGWGSISFREKDCRKLNTYKNYFAFIYGKLRPKQKRGDDLLNYIPNFRGEGSTSFISKTQFQIIIFWSYCEPHWVQVNLCLKTPRLKFILLLDFTTFFTINDVLRKQYIDWPGNFFRTLIFFTDQISS